MFLGICPFHLDIQFEDISLFIIISYNHFYSVKLIVMSSFISDFSRVFCLCSLVNLAGRFGEGGLLLSTCLESLSVTQKGDLSCLLPHFRPLPSARGIEAVLVSPEL